MSNHKKKANKIKNRGSNEKPDNKGVFGVKLLPEKLQEAIAKFGHMTDEELDHHKMTHGHCIRSKY